MGWSIKTLLVFAWQEMHRYVQLSARLEFAAKDVPGFLYLMLSALMIIAGISGVFYPVLGADAILAVPVLVIAVFSPFVYFGYFHQEEYRQKRMSQVLNNRVAANYEWMEKRAKQMADDIVAQRIQRRILKSDLPDVVYFVLNSDNQTVKIGFTTDLQQRLSSLQTSSPTKLHVLATQRGNVKLERKLHKQFAHLQTSGEWFSYGPEVQAYVSRLTVSNFRGHDWTVNDVAFEG